MNDLSFSFFFFFLKIMTHDFDCDSVMSLLLFSSIWLTAMVTCGLDHANEVTDGNEVTPCYKNKKRNKGLGRAGMDGTVHLVMKLD
jgi:hypothetical protein